MGTSSSALSTDEQFTRLILIGDIPNIVEFLDAKPHYMQKPLTNKLWTPLMCACSSKQVEIVKLFIENFSIDLDETDYDGCTALHISVFGKDPATLELIEYLCNKGANPFVKSLSGVTPRGLAFAMQSKRAESLLQHHECHGTWVKMPWQSRVRLLWLHNRTVLMVLPFSLIKEICMFMYISLPSY